MRIAYVLDENYIDMARASIASYKFWNPNAKIIVVSERPLPKDMGYDENIIIKLPKIFRNRGNSDRITNAAYLKCFLTQLPYRRVLYVDPDTICQKPLRELYNKNCPYICIAESHERGKKQAQALGLERYGITSVMLMNLEELRKIDFTNLCLNVVENSDIPTQWWQHDETAINLAMKDKLTFIDVKYSYCHNRKYDNPIPEEDAYILHYVGDTKKDMPKFIKYPEIKEIGEHIKDKRIAIVGNARSIFSKKYGKEIDDHDFIIRFNKGFILDKESQGSKTNLLILACLLTPDEINMYHADYVCNRSKSYQNPTRFTIRSEHRANMKQIIGSQPSTGFMAVDICLNFNAKSIDLYGFDWGKTDTFYNPVGYVVPHNYNAEEDYIREYVEKGLVKIN